MEVVEVTARFSPDGKVDPLRLHRKGREVMIESAGRRWTDEAGLHILIMLYGGQVFELLFDPQQTLWYLRQLSTPRPAV
jgi:hypothetical protein